MEMLIVIAIVAVLISVAVPVLSSQLERSREAVDLANVRSAYAQVSTEALLGNTGVTVTVKLKQKQAGWHYILRNDSMSHHYFYIPLKRRTS